MKITRTANLLRASHISGPTHNLLEVTLAAAPARTTFIFDAPSSPWPVQAVQAAIHEAFDDAGGAAALGVSSIRVLGSDTPNVPVYRSLARKLAAVVQAEAVETDHLQQTRVAG